MSPYGQESLKTCLRCGRRKKRTMDAAPGGWICRDIDTCLDRRGDACAEPDPEGSPDACRRAWGHQGVHAGLTKAWRG